MPSRCCASSSDCTAPAKLAVDAYDTHCCKLVALAQGLVALAWNVCPAQELQSLTKPHKAATAKCNHDNTGTCSNQVVNLTSVITAEGAACLLWKADSTAAQDCLCLSQRHSLSRDK